LILGTINHVSCNVYDRSGTKLAHIVDDGGTVKYDEDIITAGTTDDLDPYWIASGQQQPLFEPPEVVGY